MENGEWNGMRLSPKCQDTLSFKGQKPKNYAGKRKGTKEIKASVADRGCTAVRPKQHGHASTTTGRGEHHGLPMVTSGLCGSVASRTLRFVLFVVRGFLPWIIPLGSIGLHFANFLDLLGPQLHSFSYYLAYHA